MRSRVRIARWICGMRFSGPQWHGPTGVRASPPNCGGGGRRVNPKRVYRLMREDNPLCVRRRKFVVKTDSNHGRKVYPNLARNLILTATDQPLAGQSSTLADGPAIYLGIEQAFQHLLRVPNGSLHAITPFFPTLSWPPKSAPPRDLVAS